LSLERREASTRVAVAVRVTRKSSPRMTKTRAVTTPEESCAEFYSRTNHPLNQARPTASCRNVDSLNKRRWDCKLDSILPSLLILDPPVCDSLLDREHNNAWLPFHVSIPYLSSLCMQCLFRKLRRDDRFLLPLSAQFRFSLHDNILSTPDQDGPWSLPLPRNCSSSADVAGLRYNDTDWVKIGNNGSNSFLGRNNYIKNRAW